MRIDEMHRLRIEKEMADAVIEIKEKEEICAEERPSATSLALVSQSEPMLEPEKKVRGKKKAKEETHQEEVKGDGFPDLAKLMNTTVEQLKDEFFLFQVRKLMSKLAKTVIRYSISDKEMNKLFTNAKLLEMDEIVVAPAFLPACRKQVAKMGEEGFKVGSIIDFPFGESTIKGKLMSVKESVNAGVDDVTVMMPSMLIDLDSVGAFKKQCAKIGKSFKGYAGIGVNASDLTEEQIKLAIRVVNKTKLVHITFVFGNATLEEVTEKMSIVKKYKDNKKVFALANVDTAEGIMALFTNGVDKILTPYADAIGEELIKRFKVKSVNLK